MWVMAADLPFLALAVGLIVKERRAIATRLLLGEIHRAGIGQASLVVEAVGIVLVVIFLSLGSLRAAIVPAVAVPLSLVGAAFLMLLAGFSINLLTLLAMVLGRA